MPTQTINIDKVEKQLAELLEIVAHNGKIVIAQNGEPLASLESVVRRKKRVPGLNHGTIWTSEDFDSPLPDDFWLGKE